MTWTRLSDDFADRPDILELSDAAFRLHVSAMVWSNRQLTNGLIPSRVVRMLGEPDVAEELVRAGLWEPVDGGHQLDWSDQESAETVRARQEANAKRNREYRERQRLHAVGDHSLCTRCSALRDASRTSSRDASRAPYPSRPDPTHREGRGGTREGAEETAGFASAAPSVSVPVWTVEHGWSQPTTDEEKS